MARIHIAVQDRAAGFDTLVEAVPDTADCFLAVLVPLEKAAFLLQRSLGFGVLTDIVLLFHLRDNSGLRLLSVIER